MMIRGCIATIVNSFKDVEKTLLKMILLFEKLPKIIPDSVFYPRLPHEGSLPPKYVQQVIPLISREKVCVRYPMSSLAWLGSVSIDDRF